MSAVATTNVKPDVEVEWYGLSGDEVCAGWVLILLLV